jgi:exodeoxyribonuclease VII large subunit
MTVERGAERVAGLSRQLRRESARMLSDGENRLERLGALLASYSYENVLARGFAVIRGPDGEALMRAAETSAGQRIEIGFADGAVPATIGEGAGGAGAPGSGSTPRPQAKPKAKPNPSDDGGQGTLL